MSYVNPRGLYLQSSPHEQKQQQQTGIQGFNFVQCVAEIFTSGVKMSQGNDGVLNHEHQILLFIFFTFSLTDVIMYCKHLPSFSGTFYLFLMTRCNMMPVINCLRSNSLFASLTLSIHNTYTMYTNMYIRFWD